MLSSSDRPACPACGSREVHAVQKLKPDVVSPFLEAVAAEDPVQHFTESAVETFYGCRRCGRDQTDAWKAVQPEDRPIPKPLIIGVDMAELGSDRPVESIVEAAHRLGIAATANNGGDSNE